MKRKDVPRVIRQIQCRASQDLDAFVQDCGLAPSDRVRRIADAVRKSLTLTAPFNDDQLRAEDSCPGALEVLPGWDSVDFVEWIMSFEDCLGVKVPWRTFDKIAGTITVAGLVKAASDSKELLADARAKSD